jgi:ubiquinone/menaquinone biosynthesis C-methylase UbiE
MTRHSKCNHYRSIEASYDHRALCAGGDLHVARWIYHDAPPEIIAHLNAMEERLAYICAAVFSGRVLDVGCGNGNVLVRLLPKTKRARFVGLDLSSRMLVRAKQRTEAESAAFGFVHGNVIELPFTRGAFDGIACLEMLVHLPSKETISRAIDEMHRVLRPGGVLVVSMLTNTLSLRGGFINVVLKPLKPEEPDLLSLHSSRWLVQQLRRRGFHIEWYEGWDRPIVNRSYLYWLNWPLRIFDRMHAALSRPFPYLHLLRDRIVFRCVK